MKPKVEQKEVKEKTKLTYGERLEFAELEKEIAKLETRKQEITHSFEEGKLSAEELQELSKEMNELIEILDEKEMRWLELSEYES